MAGEPRAEAPAEAAKHPRRRREVGPTMLGVPLLAWSIATMALCFLPLGLVGVVTSLRAAAAAERSDPIRASQLWRVTRRWIIATILVGLAVDLFILLVLLLLGAFAG